MQAIILAAGMGKRLKALTRDNTKCMVEVNGVSLIERMLRQLDELSLDRIVLVVGYRGQQLIDFVSTIDVRTPIEYVDNPIYDKTNNIYSLYLASTYLERDDTLLLESDLIFAPGVLRELVDDPRPTLALVDKYESWMDGTVVKIDEDDDIVQFVPGSKFRFEDIPDYYKTVNIYKFSRHFSTTHYVPFLKAYVMALGENEYYEQVLRVVMHLGDSELKAKRLTGQAWYEIDDIQDLDIAESIFAEDDVRVSALASRYGGYWRYPHLTDYCYLVNPYYPPRRMVSEMQASFERLLTQYPSGQRVNALLAAKLFGIEQARVAVGNGAAELIQALMCATSGKVGVVRPTFEEYPNRLKLGQELAFVPEDEDFRYTAADLMAFFADKELESLVLINPDNPTGNYLSVSEVDELAAWCAARGIRFVLDESFVDFADEPNSSFLTDERLAAHPTMAVVKSISKSYGVPGVRLGVLASADEELIARTRAALSIWNINSFGEFWLQIAEKYQKDYAQALEKLRIARASMAKALDESPHLHVLPSQANYVMVELVDTVSSHELTRRLLVEGDVLIKDLSAKVHRGDRQFVRLAVRTEEENARLVACLRAIVDSNEASH